MRIPCLHPSRRPATATVTEEQAAAANEEARLAAERLQKERVPLAKMGDVIGSVLENAKVIDV